MQTGIIGKKARIIKCSNKTLQGIQGTIVDETKNMVVIEVNGKEKTVEKRICTFEVEGNTFKGSDVLGNPWERIKKNKKVVARW